MINHGLEGHPAGLWDMDEGESVCVCVCAEGLEIVGEGKVG